MSVAGRQALRVLDGSYVLDRPAEGTVVDLRADVLAVLRIDLPSPDTSQESSHSSGPQLRYRVRS